MKNKKKPLDPLPKIKRRILSLWSKTVRERSSYKCEYCGIEKGAPNKNSKKSKIDAHHLLSKSISNCPLKYDIQNGIALCTEHHKFGIPSFHKDPLSTVTWLQENQFDRYSYVMKNKHIRIDLDNRKVLEEIESKLKDGLPLDLEKIQEIEKTYPRSIKQKIEGSLFEAIEESEELEESSDSSEDVSN